MYILPFSLRFFSHVAYHRLLGRVPCAIEQVPAGQSFHVPQCAYASPKPLVHPSLPPPPPVLFGNGKFFKVCFCSANKSMCFPVFTVAPFTIAKIWKQPKCPSTEEWIKKMWEIQWNTTQPLKKDKITPFEP